MYLVKVAVIHVLNEPVNEIASFLYQANNKVLISPCMFY